MVIVKEVHVKLTMMYHVMTLKLSKMNTTVISMGSGNGHLLLS